MTTSSPYFCRQTCVSVPEYLTGEISVHSPLDIPPAQDLLDESDQNGIIGSDHGFTQQSKWEVCLSGDSPQVADV